MKDNIDYKVFVSGIAIGVVGFLIGVLINEITGLILFSAGTILFFIGPLIGTLNKNKATSKMAELHTGECINEIENSNDSPKILFNYTNEEYANLPDIDFQSFAKEDVWVLKNQKGFNSVEGGMVTYIDPETNIQKKASIYYNFQAIKIVFYDNTSICNFKTKYFKYDVVDCITAPLYTVVLDKTDSFRFERKKDKDAFVQYFTEYNHFLDKVFSNSKEKTIQVYYGIVNNDKINSMVKNFIEVIDENLFVDFQLNKVFVEQYLHRNELCELFLQDLNLPQINYIPNGLIYDYQTFSAFNELLSKEVQIDKYGIELLTYLLLRNGVINKFAVLWQEKYDDSKKDDEDLNKYIYRCFDTNIIDKQDGYGYALLAYYILKQKNDIYTLFPNEILNIQTIVQRVNEKQKKELFEKQILKDHTGEITENIILKPKIDDVDMMTGAEFENFVCTLYKKMGYNAYVTQTSGDQGLDVIAEKNGKRIGIQAKCYASTVGNSAIQEAVAGKSYYNCDRVVVVTNSSFTKSAISLANANNVVLWNRDILKEKINELF